MGGAGIRHDYGIMRLFVAREASYPMWYADRPPSLKRFMNVILNRRFCHGHCICGSWWCAEGCNLANCYPWRSGGPGKRSRHSRASKSGRQTSRIDIAALNVENRKNKLQIRMQRIYL